MKLGSSAFHDGDDIPRRYACDGLNLSPPPACSGAPAPTRGFALLRDDPDAPRGTWRRWAVYDPSGRQCGAARGGGRQGARSDAEAGRE